MENGLKKLVDLGASAIHRAYILGKKCPDSVATIHAHRAIIVALEALGLTDEAVDALLARQAAVVPPPIMNSMMAGDECRLDKPVENK
jgi:hypothetical protein